jgi:hypothetical protein
MSKIGDNNLFGGNWRSKFLFVLSFIFLCLAVVILVSKIQIYDPVSKEITSSETPWKIVILFFLFSSIAGYVAYRFAGGRKNPSTWKDENLHKLLRHTVLSGQAKIGLHTLRDQKLLLKKLKSIGLEKKWSEDPRQFIREKVIKDPEAFNVLRDDVIIKMIHNRKEWFWDGHGNKKTAQCFHEAEIIFDIKSLADYMFSEVLEGLKNEKQKKEVK